MLSLSVNPEIGVDLVWNRKYAGASPAIQTEHMLQILGCRLMARPWALTPMNRVRFSAALPFIRIPVAELVDAVGLDPTGRKAVQVRVLSGTPFYIFFYT